MEKPNFQRETEKAIERLCVVSRPPLLLHACCAPCSSYVLEYLTQYFSITLFFCNPNITDPAEYQKRLAELLETLRRYRLEPKVLRFVQKNGVSAPSLVLLACRKDGRAGLTVQPPLLLQNADGTETEELRRIYFKDKG